ncbi:glutamate--tRNA ligase [Candidatus Uhrbacteria bacterium]|nr:glutamate--tRNA ligase [Candidatus Uhrbacteria bacterium]
MMNVKTRFPPSPTGYLHVGSLRTALYNYFFAKKYNGKFLLRIEDTDRERYVEGAVESLIGTLERMKIDYDEGPVVRNGKIVEKGNNGPYVQSARLEIYKKYANQLVDSGHAYYCFCSKERLTKLREQQQAIKQTTKYDRNCLKLSAEEIQTKLQSGESNVIRMKIPDGKTMFHDEIRGDVTIDNQEIDDQVLLKADGFPTYHLAVVVDDYLMGVTHIIRGEEWISSVPKHVILYNWFGFPIPIFAHLPLILNPDKTKLSKRQGDVAVEDYLAKGFLEEALENFVSLLGFNPTADREIYTREELIEHFDLKKINKSGAVFDVNKLLWMNGQYIKKLSDEDFVSRVKPFLKGKVEDDILRRICKIEKSRINLLSDISAVVDSYQSNPVYEKELLVWKKSDSKDAKLQLKNILEFISSIDEIVFNDPQLIEQAISRYIKDNDLENGNVLWPLRVSLSGAERSPSPFELLWVLQKQESLKRIEHAVKILS